MKDSVETQQYIPKHGRSHHRFTLLYIYSLYGKGKGTHTHTHVSCQMSEYQFLFCFRSFFFLLEQTNEKKQYILEDAFTVHVTQPFSNSPKDGLEKSIRECRNEGIYLSCVYIRSARI
mmetsp:Transcript_9202/g.12362  ORF Transcript_9202/g.12362 Transcript_9202/m.12362 type:complete len:118 (-) Transcript_9202:108-461(-)